MSQVFPKDEAEKLAFTYQPRVLRVGVSDIAKEFVEDEEKRPNDFKINPLIEQTSGMAELKKRQLETEVEEAVLNHVKTIEESAYQKAYELGLSEGREKAFAETTNEIQQKLQNVNQLLKNLEHLKLLMIKENEVTIVKLALEIGRKIALRELALDQEPIISMLRELMEGVKKDEKVLIRLSQADVDFIEDLRKRTGDKVDFLQGVKLVASADIQSGGCVLETNFGAIDTTIPERIERVWDALLSKVPDLRSHKTDAKDSDGDSES